MDRAAKIATLLNRSYYADMWRGIAGDIKSDVLKNGWNDKMHSFTQCYGSPYVDASLLLMAEYGFIDPDDIRFKMTVRAVKDSLFNRGLMYRYTNPDDFGSPSSSFTICTFWLVQALVAIGQKEEAESIFTDLLSCGNHLGLFSEDIDFSTRRLLGNFPQAYSHLALINTATLFSQQKFISGFIKP